MTWLTMERRQKIYLALGCLGSIALFYGFMGQEEVALWLGLAGTILGNGMATVFSGRAYGKHSKAE